MSSIRQKAEFIVKVINDKICGKNMSIKGPKHRDNICSLMDNFRIIDTHKFTEKKKSKYSVNYSLEELNKAIDGLFELIKSLHPTRNVTSGEEFRIYTFTIEIRKFTNIIVGYNRTK